VGDGPRDTAGAQSTECALCRLLQDEEAFLGYLVGEVRPPKNDTLSNWREQLADWKAYDFVWVSDLDGPRQLRRPLLMAICRPRAHSASGSIIVQMSGAVCWEAIVASGGE